MKRINIFPRSFVICMSGLLIMLFLSVWAVMAMPATPRAVASAATQVEFAQSFVLHLDGHADLQLIHRALAKLQAKGQVGRILSSSAALLHVEATAEALAELEGIAGVAKVTSQSLAHPFSSLSNQSSRASSQAQERALSSGSQSSQPSAPSTSIGSPMAPPPSATPPPSYPPPTPVGNSTIAGTVTAPDGTPLEGVQVVAFDNDDESDYWGWGNPALSDGNGQYTLTDLHNGSYRVGFFSSNANYVDEYYNDAREIESATDVLLAASQTVSGVNAQLSEGAHITGLVTDEEGNPLPNVTVEAYQYSERNGYWQSVGSTQSDANGHYNVAGLRTGMAKVGFVDGEGGQLPEFYDNAPDLSSATDIAVTFEETTTGIDAQLADGSHITGTVTDENGNPLPQVLVQLYLYDEMFGIYGIPYWGPINYAYTDSNGQYDIGGVAPGTYRVGFDDEIGGHIPEFYDEALDVERATDVAVTSDQTRSGIDAQLAEGGHIRGTITDQNGNRLPEIEVRAYRYNKQDGYWQQVRSGLTDSNGQYNLGGLRSRTYRVGFFPSTSSGHRDSAGGHVSEYYNNVPDLESATSIVVTEGQTSENIDASLNQVGHITGLVTDPDGNPLSSVGVRVFSYDDADGSWAWHNSVSSDSNGQYHTNGLISGTYRLGFFDWQDRYPPEFYNNALDVESATDVLVTSGETTSDINVSLNEGGHITGIVSDANGNPLPGITVNFYHYDSQYGFSWRINHTHTDASGAYDIPGLSSGTYAVSFSDWEGRYLYEYYNDVANIESATDLSVTLGQTTAGINASLSEGGHIIGTITNQEGDPLPNIAVELYQYHEAVDYWHAINDAQTDASGRYDIAGLRSGIYRVGFSDSEGRYLPEYYDDVANIESATDLSVTQEQTTAGIDASLTEGGHIIGTISNQEGDPLPNMAVALYQYDETVDHWRSIKDVPTDASGRYDLAGLTSGIYRVGFSDREGRYLPEYYDDVANIESATDLSVIQEQTTAGIDAQLAEGGHITGRVTAPDGSPLPDVSISVYRLDRNGEWLSAGYGYSDSDGRYDVGGLHTGTYRVGFLDSERRGYLSEYYNNASDLEEATDIAVTESQTTAGIDAQLAEGGYITGRVTTPNGSAFPYVLISVYRLDGSGQWVWAGYGYGDFDGSYDVIGLHSGVYRLAFSDFGGRYLSEYYNDAPDLERATNISVTAGQTTEGIDAQLAEGGHITGLVTTPNGSALPSVSIEVYRLDGNGQWVSAGYNYSDFDGRYDVMGLPTGVYRVGFSQLGGRYLSEYYNNTPDLERASNISVTAGQTTEGIDAQLAEGGHITGLVTSAEGTPLPYASIEVYRHHPNGDLEWARSAYTNSDGSYDVLGLHTGSYRVGFFDWGGPYANEYYHNATDLDSATDVAVTVGETTEAINASLEMGGTITGHVAAPDGSPASDVSVEVYRRNHNGEWEWAGGSGYSHFNGQYEINGLASGTYRVGFHPWSTTYFTKYYSDTSDLESATDVSLTQGETTSEIDVQLSEGGHITGTVTLDSSSSRFVAGEANPLAGIQIEAYRQNGLGEWEWAGSAATNRTGQYDISGLASGTYRVGFFEHSGFYGYQYYENASDLENATDITVIAGESTPNIDAALADAAEAVANASSRRGGVTVDAQTGEITIVQENGKESDVTISQVVTCPSTLRQAQGTASSGTVSDGEAPSDVSLMVGQNSYPMMATDNSQQYAVTLRAAQVVDGAEIKVTKVCNDNSDEEMIGQIELIEPNGYVTDATTGYPIANANLTLYNVPSWQARTAAGQSSTPNTCQSNLSKAVNEPWSQSAPTDLGVMAPSHSGAEQSLTNPIRTDAQGYYGWDIAAGCWYVVVEATGYQTLVSPVVGAPPKVTELNLALTPSNTQIVQFSATSYQANEMQQSATIAITLLRPLTETVTLEYSTSNQTATAGKDYSATNGQISIPAGETVKTFSVRVLDDDTIETDETIILTLSNPDKGTLGTHKQATLTIADDDDPLLNRKIYLPLLAQSAPR